MTGPVEREEAARQAAQELLKPIYDKEPLFDQIYRRVTQFLGDLVDTATGGGTAGGVIAAVVIVLIILGLVLLISWQLRRTARKRGLPTGGLFGERAMSAAEHRAAAARLAAESRWTEAIQERLRAIARDLEERALVDGMPGRTADELTREAAVALPGFTAELAAAARSFDDVTYGGTPGTRQAYETMTSLDERLRQARPVPLGAATPPGAWMPVGASAGLSGGASAGLPPGAGAWPGADPRRPPVDGGAS
ncbi:protein of unknown function [Nonomuraea jiangxiensis]|uniref:Protein-glutamine gamma-glutamyltransferase-like C-terminal domain-containing protein n=1 Tax=Nonomuraea jiangxiensis TaxID=633440 RepID=A0A1G8F348_9ACTN|nr:protein of unknown function [Nonomuraea jiangxiensis]